MTTVARFADQVHLLLSKLWFLSFTGVGMSANQVYREDGTPCSAHEYEDRSIHFCLDRENQTFLYAVFDGHDGAKAAYFSSQVYHELLYLYLL